MTESGYALQIHVNQHITYSETLLSSKYFLNEPISVFLKNNGLQCFFIRYAQQTISDISDYFDMLHDNFPQTDLPSTFYHFDGIKMVCIMTSCREVSH